MYGRGDYVMNTGSPRDTVRAGIVAVAIMSFLLGIFSMVGIQRLAQNDSYYIFAFLPSHCSFLRPSCMCGAC
jgi:hypothetical protein